MRWRDAALAIAAASVAVGTASASAHSQDDGPGDEAAAVVAGLVDASPYLPLSRLGRWDGTSFVIRRSRVDRHSSGHRRHPRMGTRPA